MSSKRKVAVVVTARPSYSRIKTVLTALKNDPKVELQLIAAASTLLDRYGNTSNLIEKDGFTITAKVYNVLEGESPTSMAKTTGLGIMELSDVFLQIEPDLVVTVADRFETMATAIAASYMNIPLAHIQGGEVTGNIDEKVRHSITKLSDIHLVASERAKQRVIKMGEDPNTVIKTGCPSIDIAADLLENSEITAETIYNYGGVGEKFDIVNRKYLVVMQHPVTTEIEGARNQIDITLQVIKELNIPTFWFWPNVDAGSDMVSKGIRHFRETNADLKIHFFKNLDPTDFLKLLKNSACLIGNSSVGIRECSFLGVPVVNIGSRQEGRERGRNVIDTDYNVTEIKQAILDQMANNHYESDYIYGNGNAGKKIATLLQSVKLTFSKQLTY